jgi:hypothetical protein
VNVTDGSSRLFSQDVVSECRERVQRAMSEDKPTNRVAAGVVVIWLLLAVLAVVLVTRMVRW